MYKTTTLSIAPEWDNIEVARVKVAQFLLANELQQDSIDTIVMVISELLENSLKYGSYTGKDDEVRVYIEISSSYIVVEVRNPIDDGCLPNLKKMDRMIQWVRGYQDPFEAYVQRLKLVSRKPMKDKESGLGLARIAYEGDVTLDFISNKNSLSVSALKSLSTK